MMRTTRPLPDSPQEKLPAPRSSSQKLKRFLLRIFLTVLGRIKCVKFPLWMIYDPGSYKVNGADCRLLIGNLRPGDILLRGYDGFLDSFFIRRTRTAKGPRVGIFTHAAVFVGQLDRADRPDVACLLEGYDWDTNACRTGPELERYRETQRVERFDTVVACQPPPGEPVPRTNQMVIHAMADGVKIEDILTFARCDELIILRLPEDVELKPQIAAVESRDSLIDMAHVKALGLVGSEYDFGCNDLKSHHFFSCAEFVYFCYREVSAALGIIPCEHGVWGWFGRRTTVAPDDFLCTHLEKVWWSHTLDKGSLNAFIQKRVKMSSKQSPPGNLYLQ